MTFAFKRENRAKIVRNIANLRTFAHGGSRAGGYPAISGARPGQHARGRGTAASARNLGALPRQYAHGLAEAVYVVYCYGTPIAWVTMADDATEEGRINFMPDWQYSATTTYHQGLVWEAWGDKIVDPNPRYSKAENRGTARGRSSDARYNRNGARQLAAQRREADYAPRPVSPRSSHAADAAHVRFSEQDALMDEVRSYRHPAHP